MLQHGGAARGEVVCPAQESLDLGEQHVHVERFGNEIVGAHVDRHHDVHVVSGRRYEHDRDFGYPADLATPVVAVEEGQGYIHQHEVRLQCDGLGKHVSEVRADF